MFADLQGDFAALAEETEGMFADPGVMKEAVFVGYLLGEKTQRTWR